MPVLRGCLLIALILGVVGCAGEPKKAKVSGTVQLDSKPLASGEINFVPTGGGPPEVLKIVNGKYQGEVGLGTRRVALYSYVDVKPAPNAGPGADAPSQKNTLPERYGRDSKEEREVTARGPNTFNFELTSK